MKRSGTDIMAIGAILGGAAIGATGTLALAGNPFGGDARAELGCEYVHVAGDRMRAAWIYSVDGRGELRRKRCRRMISTTVFARETPAFDQTRQAELAALARELAVARTRLEVIRAQERRKVRVDAAEMIRSLEDLKMADEAADPPGDR